MSVYSLLQQTSIAPVSLDIREDARIICIHLDIAAINPTPDVAHFVELSFLSALAYGNDQQGVLLRMFHIHETTATGIFMTSRGSSVMMDEPVSAGERVYLHLSSALLVATAFIYTTGDGAAMKRAIKRR